ncbi:MAG: DUF3596 domain-containing protein [Pseudomonas sp.]|uniref:Arm DNA-binding domain-containing protein n=1 Tax=Pseudomonas sp. TaxID=306 RepID=UPI003315A119
MRFTRNGKRRGEAVAHPPTEQGIKAAGRLHDQIANHNLLDDEKYAELFPGSEAARQAADAIPSLGAYTQMWLDRRDIVQGSRNNYKSIFNIYWMPYVELRRLEMLLTSARSTPTPRPSRWRLFDPWHPNQPTQLALLCSNRAKVGCGSTSQVLQSATLNRRSRR